MPETVIRFTGKQLKTEDQVKAFEMNDGFIKSRLRPTHGEALGRTYFNEKTQSRTWTTGALLHPNFPEDYFSKTRFIIYDVVKLTHACCNYSKLRFMFL